MVKSESYTNFSSIHYRNLDVINFVFGGFRNDPIPQQFGSSNKQQKYRNFHYKHFGLSICCNLI